MGDFNAKIGKRREEKLVGSHGLGIRNETRDLFSICAKEHQLVVLNTYFKQHPR